MASSLHPIRGEDAKPVEPEKLTSLRNAWTQAKERDSRPIKDKYLSALIKLRKELTQQGKLEAAVLVRHEIEVLTQGAKPIETEGREPAKLGSLRSIYDREIGRTNEQNKRKYLTALKSLKQAYSTKGELEAALAVKAELDKLAGRPATDSVLPAGVLPLETSLTKGLALFEFDPLDSQQDDSNIGVHYSKFGVPLGKPKRVSEIDGLTYDREHNAVATGYLRIEKSGEYGFSTYNFYDRNALYVKDLEKPLCGYRDHREKHTIELPAGYVPLVAVSYIKTRGSFETVIWKPPGAEDYEPIPAKLLYFDRERAATSIGVPEK